ncbi:MAG: DUF87 domain-containing protein, partial [Chloroflexota bacterium]
MTHADPIGTAKGPGEQPNQYTFVSPDPEQRVKHGEYVFYEATVGGERRAILGRVSQRLPLRLYPDTYMADPAIAPEAIASLLGFEQPSPELFELTATVLGYYDPGLGFVNPRVPPRTGEPIYIAADAMLAEVLSRVRPEEQGAVHLGWLLSRAKDAVPIALDARGFTSTHLAIIASTGSGKSYLAGVVLEELMRPHNRAAVLVVDPHAEYDTLDAMMGHPAFAEGSYRPTVRVVRPTDIKVRVSSLTQADLRYLLRDVSDRMDYVLGRALRRASQGPDRRWTRDELMVAVHESGLGRARASQGEEEEQEDSSVTALLWRLDSVLMGSTIFDDFTD